MSLEAQAQQIKAALDALVPTHAKACDWYMGEITAQGLAQGIAISRTLFLAFESETLDEAASDVTTSGEGTDVAMVVWRVYCAVSDQRSPKATMETWGLPGMMALTAQVKSTLNRMRFTGDAAADVVSAAHMQFMNDRPALIQRSVVLVHALRFGYLRTVEQAEDDPLAGTVKLQRVDTSIKPNPDGAHNPLARSRNTFP